MTTFKTLHVTPEGPVLHVQLNSPETGNAITETLLDELLDVLGTLHHHPAIRVLILSGSGNDFCLGGDRNEFAQSLATDPTGAGLRAIGNKARQVHDALATANVVTIARLHGAVIGGGLALAAFCDLRAGADTCRFRMPELALGLPPAWGGALPRLLHEAGAAKIRELLLTGDNFTAAKAAELAILHKVVAEDELDGVIEQWTRPLVRKSPAAVRTAKLMMSSFASAHRLADATLLDTELLASMIVSAAPPART